MKMHTGSAGLRCGQQRSHLRACTRSARNRLRHSRPIIKLAAVAEPQEVEEPEEISDVDDLPPMFPRPGIHQQTLRKSFTLGGIGIHSAEYAYVRVRPAYAGEGRYFVRVPEGTNSDRFVIPENQGFEELPNINSIEPNPPQLEDLKVEIFTEYLKVQEVTGVHKTFEEYFNDELSKRGISPLLNQIIDEEEGPQEPPAEGFEGEVRVPASCESIVEEENNPFFQVLGKGENQICGAEHLLSALEACGVDNARIEIEGGQEIPVLDGSAGGWATEIHVAGLALAKSKEGGDEPVQKKMLAPTFITTCVREEAFATFYPGPGFRISYGIDESHLCEIIGRQWFTYSMDTDMHYGEVVASARSYLSSPDMAMRMRDMGLLMGGTENCFVIGLGDRWYDPQMVRFHDDEPVRHKIVDLIGDLSLLNEGGRQGIPQGHVVVYRGDHQLHADLVREIQKNLKEQDVVDAVYVTDEALGQVLEAMQNATQKMQEALEAAGNEEQGEGGDLEQAREKLRSEVAAAAAGGAAAAAAAGGAAAASAVKAPRSAALEAEEG